MVYDPDGVHRRGLLPYRPAPHPESSLHGYAVNLAIANGYPSPVMFLGNSWHLPRDAENFLDRMVAASGLDQQSLRAMTYLFGHTVPSPHPRHGGGIRVASGKFYHASPHFCPRCWAEKRLIKKSFEFKLANACTDHGCEIQRTCVCGKKFTWGRLTKGKCECGQVIADITPIKASLKDMTLSYFYGGLLRDGLTALDVNHPLLMKPGQGEDSHIITVLKKKIGLSGGRFTSNTVGRVIKRDWQSPGKKNLRSKHSLDGRIPPDWFPSDIFVEKE